MPKFDGFVGAAYEARSRRFNAQRLKNLYVEADQSGNSQDAKALLGTPGLRLRATLPVERFRGFFAGDNRLFAVVANKLYEIFHKSPTVTTDGTLVAWNAGPFFDSDMAGEMVEISGVSYEVATVTDNRNLVLTASAGTQRGVRMVGPTTWSHLGDVGDDVDHSRAQIFANGTQIFVVSAGYAWIHDGVTLRRALLSNGAGTVTTAGTAVTRISGNQFDDSLIGNPIYINDIEYIVSAVTDADNLILTATAGVQGNAAYTITQWLSGTADVNDVDVTWVSGDQFAAGMVGELFWVEDVPYEVASVADATHLVLTTAAPEREGVAFRSSLAGEDGTATVSGTTVTKLSGTAFTALAHPLGAEFFINGTSYKIESITSGTVLELTEDGGTIDKPEYRAYTYLPARMGAYSDSKFIASKQDSNQFYVSPVRNGLFWDAADVGEKNSGPDRMLGILVDHNELWLFGYKTTEVWVHTGTGPANGFQREHVIERGTAAPWAAASLDDGVAWIAADERGSRYAVYARGYQPQRITTPAIEDQWRSYATVSDAESYSYEEDGHSIWVVHFPSANATWAYDATTNTWAERSTLILLTAGQVDVDGTDVTWTADDKFRDQMEGQPIYLDGIKYTVASVTDDEHLVLTEDAGTQVDVAYEGYERRYQVNRRVHAFAFGLHWAGDGETGNLYEQSLDYFHDDGVPIERLRSAPHITNEQKMLFYHRFQLDHEAGGGAPDYTDLEIDAADDTKMTSAANPFTLADKGQWLTITGGTGFTQQRVKIIDVVGNLAECSKSLGGVGSIDGLASPDRPLVKLEYSKNQGKTYVTQGSVSSGQLPDEDLMRALWNRMPCARTMTFQVSSEARIRHAWVGAIIETTPGYA